MYLKRIEAIGFKSFATKTVIHFDRGLTAIVGPNGSGKSNVSDAIRFVLGEQSVKSLRGGKMEDLIFSGTDDKKALNMAEVIIVLDNESRDLPLDFSEVSMTRRVYRSGGGEYLINGEKARLKDVTDLIMDSGIGHDSLSMISQDQVKQVIEGKPEDRRLILEESAGILKYKMRKKEAVRKLTYTHENLQRVQDILNELDNQLEPLRIQAKEAKAFLTVKGKLSDLEIRLLAHDIKGDHDELSELKSKNESLTIQMLTLTKQTEADALTQTKLTDAHHELTHQIQELQFELTRRAERVQKKRGEADVMKERIAHASMNKAQLAGRQQELTVMLTRLQEEIKTAEAAVRGVHAQLDEKQQADQEAYRIKHIVPLEAAIEKANLLAQEASSAFEQAEQVLKKLHQQNQHGTYQLASAKSQLNFLLDAKEDFVGFSEGTKHVLQAKKKGALAGIEGAVAELVTIPSEYEVAFDVILGPVASQVVTTHDGYAKRAIAYLKENRLGRVTFLPMNVMKSRQLAPPILRNLQNMTGFVSLASEALAFDVTYQRVIESLVGHVIIAKDLDSANQMARMTSHRFRIVTLTGDVVNPGGSMTGGAMNRKNSASVLKQNQQLTKQRQQIAELEDTLLNLEVKKQAASQHAQTLQARVIQQSAIVQDLQSQLAHAHDQRLRSSYELKVEVATLKTQLQSQQSEVNRLTAECQRVESEVKTVATTLDNHDATENEFQVALRRLEDDMVQTEQEKEHITTQIREERTQLIALTETLKTLEIENREARRTMNDVHSSLNQLSGVMGKLDVKIDLAIEKLERDYEMTFDYALLHYPLRSDVAGARTEVQGLSRQLAGFGSVNTGAIDEYERVKERYDFLESESTDLIIAAENLQASIDEMDHEMVTKFKETFDLVRLHYIETFTELFGGGQADLVLTDPHDLLNTGVEVVARPPGTKLGTSTLLSGGQKALTSIAMLFAILKVRTIPFCMLDEVEAALDEANVTRYAKYLKHFSDQTQFIVVTHRRGTMEEADRLYGVTMQEQGITTLVSVKMDRIDHYLDHDSGTANKQ
ncbi:MAG: chromosome segregation protein SMC [Defluviitaleaceae bacterium]|nr:chromosome segregation protein SMC [Defluviitaleaceae bacterium]